jgi:pimeloyl-ACP methyl ester carboxylesterase
MLLITGRDDDTVPPGQSAGFARLARAAGDDVRLDVVDGEGHIGHLDPGTPRWARTRQWLDRLGGGGGPGG